MELMKIEVIKAIFTNVLFVIGVVVLMVGFIRGVMVGAKLVSFEKYPLNGYEETRCEMETSAILIPDKTAMVAADKESTEKRKVSCLESLERQRSVQKVDDITSAFGAITAGGLIAIVFRKR